MRANVKTFSEMAYKAFAVPEPVLEIGSPMLYPRQELSAELRIAAGSLGPSAARYLSAAQDGPAAGVRGIASSVEGSGFTGRREKK